MPAAGTAGPPLDLAHNGVRWELGPNKSQKVRDSIAFKIGYAYGLGARNWSCWTDRLRAQFAHA